MSIRFNNSCQQCVRASLCLYSTLAENEKGIFDEQIMQRRPLQRNQFLFSVGDNSSSLFIVKSGALKVFELNEFGNELVWGFYLPGEIVGFDTISTTRHANFAKALATTVVCEIPYASLEILAENSRKFQRQLIQTFSREISVERRLRRLLSESAYVRICQFLIDVSRRNGKQGMSATRFTLPMSRADIGAYLDLRVETVSRVLTQIQNDGLLKVCGREVSLINMDQPASRELMATVKPAFKVA